jgi:hypothetical protein
MVVYQLRGDADAYRMKVYGNTDVTVSPTVLTGQHEAWDIREAYCKGYELYEERIQHEILTGSIVQQITQAYEGRVISTVPLPSICLVRNGHQFPAARVWAIGDAPERGVQCPIKVSENTVVCNGFAEPAWYRASTILGYSTAEWPSRPPLDGAALVNKPIRNTCDCHPSILRLGRYGTWTKGVLSHDAYWNVVKEY